MAYEGSAPQPEQAAGGADKAAEVTADADRQVVVTGQVDMSVTDPIAAAADVVRIVESAGGHIQERYEQAARDGNAASASVVARIPADRVTSTLAELPSIGDVVNSSQSSTEVTAQARDLDARIRALQISIGRLEDLLTRSGSVADVVSAEQVLTDRQSQLEQLQSERAALAEQVAMSTFTIRLWPDGSVPSEPPTGFLSGLAAGWNGLVATGRVLLIVLGTLLPWLVVAGLLTAVALPLVRRLRRRSAAKAPRSASSASPGGWPSGIYPLQTYPAPPGAPQPSSAPVPAPGPGPEAAQQAAQESSPKSSPESSPQAGPPPAADDESPRRPEA